MKKDYAIAQRAVVREVVTARRGKNNLKREVALDGVLATLSRAIPIPAQFEIKAFEQPNFLTVKQLCCNIYTSENQKNTLKRLP
ncbi:hypothetical protein ACFL1D_03265 [Candidatus Omnitrophota bacterium]